ncbi:hypothetical protein JXB22_05330 [candidate division WOR-3 bacterium]|nr:hypothetical protein [candidate division WOR-3 bacterium]
MKKKIKKSKKQKESKNVITIKPTYKHRVPHKPTRAHRNRKKYTRKGKIKDEQRTALAAGEEK